MTRPEKAAWIIATLALLAAVFGNAFAPDLFPHAWLSAFVLVSAWPLGSIALLLIHPLTGGRWGEALTPALRLGVATTPLLIPLVVPVLLTLPALYPWAAYRVANAWYLNPRFFALRGVVYLVTWCALAALILMGRARAVAAPGLILLGLTVNFAAIDLTMSLDPGFDSSAYGMLAAAGAVLFALSVATLLAAPTTDARTRGDLGKLMLALLILWIYLDFMQFLIVWQSDLVSETPWYRTRMFGPWGAVYAVITLDHFVLPFAILLAPYFQRNAVGAVALLLAVTEVFRTWWTVLPAVPRNLTWVDLACMVGAIGLAAGLTLRLQNRAADRAMQAQADYA